MSGIFLLAIVLSLQNNDMLFVDACAVSATVRHISVFHRVPEMFLHTKSRMGNLGKQINGGYPCFIPASLAQDKNGGSAGL